MWGEEATRYIIITDMQYNIVKNITIIHGRRGHVKSPYSIRTPSVDILSDEIACMTELLLFYDGVANEAFFEQVRDIIGVALGYLNEVGDQYIFSATLDFINALFVYNGRKQVGIFGRHL